MNKSIRVVLTLVLTIALTGTANANAAQQIETVDISGSLIQGLRILPIEYTDEAITLNVYRGDYIKFDFDRKIQNPVLEIPVLYIKQKLPDDLDSASYFKMKKTGRFGFTLGTVTGHIQVFEYQQPYYREVDAKQAAHMLNKLDPILLDVRTRREYNRGHIPDAMLIPVQELQKRIGELSAYQHTDILIYCATGNRSTVASKILIDSGFKRIINMRYGIAQWARNKYPVTK
jgi:rhodanese-related sulfurtransferase